MRVIPTFTIQDLSHFKYPFERQKIRKNVKKTLNIKTYIKL